MIARQSATGFTLIELLVALIILSLLSIAGYRGLNSIILTRQHIAEETRRWQHLAQFFARLEEDISQANRRPVRSPDGKIQVPWIGNPAPQGQDDAELTFTRSGSSESDSSQFSPQRIAYRFENNSVTLLHWSRLDQAPNSRPVHLTLLSGVSTFRIRYMDTGGNWYPQWPISNIGMELPAATEVSVALESGELITRIFAL